MRRGFRLIFLVALATALAAWWAWSTVFVPGSKRLQESKDEITSLEAQRALVKAENTRLKDKRDRLQHDPLYQEKIIREKLKYVRKDEIVYQTPEE